jgi:Fe-S-cluster containining protein
MADVPWYVTGLHFECAQCGCCCAGPNEGYIWARAREIAAIAEFLKMPVRTLRTQYLRRVGLRTTIVEDPQTKDCVFLKSVNGQRRCAIYPVRPSQCRNWPFWPGNLASPDAWNRAAMRCPGVNRGRLYTHEEIDQIKE